MEVIAKLVWVKKRGRFALEYPGGRTGNYFPLGVGREEAAEMLAKAGAVLMDDDTVVKQ